MALTYTQLPGAVSPAQSPMPFSVLSPSHTGSGYQYTADIWIWSGSVSNSGSALWQMRKYPNAQGYGIFDVSRIVSTKLQDLAIENTSNLYFYKVLFGEEWNVATITGSIIRTGSYLELSQSSSQQLRVYDGYGIYPEQLATSIYQNSVAFPLMTDMVYVTQSVLLEDTGSIGLFTGNYPGKVDDKSLVFIGLYDDGSTVTSTVAASGFASSTTNDQVKQVQIYPAGRSVGTNPFAGGFPLPTVGLKGYSIQLIGTGTNPQQILNFEVKCKPKWDGYQIQWKNRYGQFDHLNMMNVSKRTFQTDQKVYQPQLGSWNSSTLSYQKYTARTQRYVVDSQEALMLNSDYLDEAWNDIMKQLLVTDECYYYDYDNATWRPITLNTNSVQFKTAANDKLIQYTLEFAIGQPFKLLF